LDERSGTVAHDYMAGNNGIYSHTTLGQPGYNLLDSHTAARFGIPSSANSYAGGIAADFATADSAAFSIEAWVNGKAQSSDCGLVAKGARGSEQFSLDCGSANHAFRFLVRDASGLAYAAGRTLVPDGQWHHLAGVCDQGNGAVLLYVDGVQAAQAAMTPGRGILGSTNSVSLGSRQSGTTIYDLQFVGFMEEVAIYGYALSSNQIQAHYSVVTNLPPPLITAAVAWQGTNLFLSWSGSATTYQVQMTTNLLTPNWQNLAGPLSATNLLFAPSNDAAFYRILGQ